MANRWLRGVIPPPAGGLIYHSLLSASYVVLYYFCKKLLGYTVDDEQWTGYGSVRTSNTDGSTTTTILTSSGSNFVAAGVTAGDVLYFTSGTDQGYGFYISSCTTTTITIHSSQKPTMTVQAGPLSFTVYSTSTSYNLDADFPNGCTIHHHASSGSLSSSNQRFTQTSYTFTSADVDRLIVVKDPNVSSAEKNCGIYRISTFVDASNVDIDFLSTDNPVTATGIEWWLVDVRLASMQPRNPETTDYDYVVWNVNHATAPYQMFMECMAYNTDSATLRFQYAAELSSWNSGTRTWNADAPHFNDIFYLHPGVWLPPTYEDYAPRIYCYGTTEGDFLWTGFWQNGGIDAYQAYMMQCVLDTDDFFESSPAYVARERLFVTAPRAATRNTTPTRSIAATHSCAWGKWWDERRGGKVQTVWWCPFKIWNSATVFSDIAMISEAQPNSRDGTEFDGIAIPIQVDPTHVDTLPSWHLPGRLPREHIALYVCDGIGVVTLLGTGSKDKMHWFQGVVTPWPGLARHT